MAGNPHLYRRSSGIYVLRLAVPLRHRALVGKSEIHVSTRLRDWNAAKLAALKIQIGWLERFMELDNTKTSTARALFSGEGWASVEESARLLGVSTKSLLTELLNASADIATYANEWLCWQVDTLSEVAREPNGAFVMNDVEHLGQRIIFSGEVRPLDAKAAISSLIAEGVWSAEVFRHQKYGGVFPDELKSIPIAAVLVAKNAVDSVRVRLGDHFSPVTSQDTPMATDAITVKHGKKKFSELFDLVSRSRLWKADHRTRMENEAELFQELMDNPTLASIEPSTILTYSERLAQLPRDVYQAKRKFQIESICQLADLARIHQLPLKGPQTVKEHISRLGDIFSFGVRNAMLHFNPASDYKRGRGKTAATRQQDERAMFEPDELNKIFSATWFKTGKGADNNWRPFYYWLPLLGLLTGCRLNEISQIYLDDIKRTQAGTWYLDINLDQPDKSDSAGDKSLKTANSIRVVPLHKRLIELGLLQYAETLRQRGEERLFPELRHDKAKGYGKAAGAWFNERFLGRRLKLERDGMKTFHSFRHTFITALERLNTHERVLTQLAGHERGRSQSSARYAKDRDADELQSTVDQVNFNVLASIVMLDIEAAEVALSVAERTKAKLRRARIARI